MYASYWVVFVPVRETAKAFTAAGRHMMTNAGTGTTLAFGPRPIPQAERRLCQYRARMMPSRPTRSPS